MKQSLWLCDAVVKSEECGTSLQLEAPKVKYGLQTKKSTEFAYI